MDARADAVEQIQDEKRLDTSHASKHTTQDEFAVSEFK